ncbi:MAG: peptidyl-prolyl cis-trans isomerase [Xanthomonadaceae bacterium]|nr:peptidyl-prolyl cis-trans isomerase [Xanthomonadaceae bacterium]
MIRSLMLLGMTVALCGCQDTQQTDAAGPGPQVTAPAEGVLARFADGTVSTRDVDEHILRLPATERPAPGEDLDAWYRQVIRTLVVNRRLLAEARASGLEDTDDFRRRHIAVRRQLAVQSCLTDWVPESGDVSAEQVRAEYDARAEELQVPERRSTFHIYRRFEPGETASEAESATLELRERILRGENFQRLAQTESDSESRHRQGSIGWVVRGQLPQAFEDIVFSLEEGVPGRPLVAADGVHLFQVDEILPARTPTLRELAPALRAQLEAASVGEALDEIAARNSAPTARMVERDGLDRLIEQGREQSPVLTTGDYELTLEQFRLRLGRSMGEQALAGSGASGRVSIDLAWASLQRLLRHEKAFEQCAREDRIDESAVARLMTAWEAEALTATMREQRLLERVTADPERLRLYYQSNIGQFTPPVQWHLRRLLVTFDDAARGKTLMARMEAAAADDTPGLDALQRETGGEIDDLGWNTLRQMGVINPKLPQLVSPAVDGELVAPLNTDQGLALFQVVARREFEPRPFEEVSDAVAKAYLRQYTSEEYDGLEREILDAARFEVFPERLNALRAAGRARPEITAEQLDALFEES